MMKTIYHSTADTFTEIEIPDTPKSEEELDDMVQECRAYADEVWGRID